MSFIGNRPDSFGYSTTTYEHFSGDSSNTTFTLSRSVTSNSDIQVVVNNVIQDPGVAYYVQNLNTLVFASAPSTGTDNIYVVYRNFVNTGFGLPANSVGSDIIASRSISTRHLGEISNIDSGTSSLTLDSNNVVISGNLTVEGATTTINVETLTIEDKNIVLANVSSPTNVTADGAGITVLGTTNKTLNWVSANNSWESSENLNLISGKSYRIGNTSVLSSTGLGSGVLSSSLTSVGTLSSLTVSGNSSFSNISSSGRITSNSVVINSNDISNTFEIKDTSENTIFNLDAYGNINSTYFGGSGWSGNNFVYVSASNAGNIFDTTQIFMTAPGEFTPGGAITFTAANSTFSGNVGIGTATSAGLLTLRGYTGGTANSAVSAFTKTLVIGGQYNQPYNSANSVLFHIADYSNDASDNVYPIYCEDENNIVDFFIQSGNTGSSLSKVAYFGGNVGIGATSPDTKLHVYSTGNANDAHGLIKAEASTASNNVNASLTTKNWSGTSQFMQWENYGLRIGSRIKTNYGQGNIYFTTGSDSIKATLYDNGGHFSASGNLHTNRGRLAFSSTATDPNHSVYNNYNNIDSEGSWDGIKMNVYAGLSVRVGNANGATPTTAMFINSSGNVGFGGVSDPVFPIDLNALSNSVAIRLRGRSSDTLSAITFDNSTANAGSSANYIQSGTSNPYIAFGTSNTERLRVDSAGKIIHYFSGAHSYGSTHVINQNAVGNSDGPKIAFKKLQSDTTTTTYAIGILNGVNEKSFAITTGSDNGFGTTLMTIDGNGRMKVPNQPAFHGYRTTSTAAGIQSGFTAIVNIGSHWVPSTGRFTAPVAGTYLFFFSTIGTGAASSSDIYLVRNGGTRQDALSVRPTSIASGYSSTGASIGIITLAANDYVEVTSSAGLYSDANCWIRFGGYLLG